MRAKALLRCFAALLVALALTLAPAIVAATHAPGAQLAPAEAAMAASDYAHGHSHDFDDAAGPEAHDAADHDHQTHALLSKQGALLAALRTPSGLDPPGSVSSDPRRGPERPPRWRAD